MSQGVRTRAGHTFRASQCLTQCAFHWTLVCHSPPGPGSSFTLTTLSLCELLGFGGTYLSSWWSTSQTRSLTRASRTRTWWMFIFRERPCVAAERSFANNVRVGKVGGFIFEGRFLNSDGRKCDAANWVIGWKISSKLLVDFRWHLMRSVWNNKKARRRARVFISMLV